MGASAVGLPNTISKLSAFELTVVLKICFFEEKMTGTDVYVMLDGKPEHWNVWTIKFRSRAVQNGYAEMIDLKKNEPIPMDEGFENYNRLNVTGL